MTTAHFRYVVRQLLLAALCAGLPLEDASGGADETLVGVTRREWVDPDRSNWPGNGPRPIRATVWYPCQGGGAEERVEEAGVQLKVHPNSRLATALTSSDVSDRRPLILLSHGSGGRAEQLLWLGHILASEGMIAVALDHNGTSEEECGRERPTLTDFFAWERAQDVSVVLSRILEDPTFADAVDERRIGAGGFSLGGTTALWVAGARLDLDVLRRNAPPPPPSIAGAIESLIAYSKIDPAALASVARANCSYRDDRIRAVFALAPPMGAGFTGEGLQDADVPALIVVGDADPIAPAEPNARHFATHMPRARLVVVTGERGHYVSPIPDAQRRYEMQEVAQMAVDFFNDAWGASPD